MALRIVISTGDFQIRWNVLSLSFSRRESGKWPLRISDFHHNCLISKAWFPFGHFFRSNKSHNEQCDAQMETSTKSQNEQQKAITSNKKHLLVLVFEIELILSQKQERATKSSTRKRTANGNTHQKPKRATKSSKEHFSIPFSFIRTSSGPMEGG